MKNSLLVLVLLLQAACLAVILGERLGEKKEDSTAAAIEGLRQDLGGTLHQQRTLTIYLDELRADLERTLAGGLTAPEQGGAAGSGSDTAAVDGPSAGAAAEPAPTGGSVSDSDTLFPQAHATMAELKKNLAALLEEQQEPGAFTGPLQDSVNELRDRLVRLGTDSLHWIHHEATLAPYDEDRDTALITYLMREVVPAIAPANRTGCYDLVRGVLLNSAALSGERIAAAEAMREIAPDQWVAQYIDVILKGAGRESPLRVALLNTFREHPQPEVVDVCRAFLEEPKSPPPLRGAAVHVLAAQPSDRVQPLLQRVLFQDHQPEVRTAALSELLGLLDDEAKHNLLRQVAETDPAEMHENVRHMAQSLLDGGTTGD